MIIGNDLNYYISSASNDKPDSGYKNNIYSTGIGVAFEQFKDIYLSPSLSFTHDDLEVEDKASSSMKKQEGTFTDLSFEYGVQLDNRDRAFMPTEGYLTSFNQTLPLYADSPFVKNAFAYRVYNSFFVARLVTGIKFSFSITKLPSFDFKVAHIISDLVFLNFLYIFLISKREISSAFK